MAEARNRKETTRRTTRSRAAGTEPEDVRTDTATGATEPRDGTSGSAQATAEPSLVFEEEKLPSRASRRPTISTTKRTPATRKSSAGVPISPSCSK